MSLRKKKGGILLKVVLPNLLIPIELPTEITKSHTTSVMSTNENIGRTQLPKMMIAIILLNLLSISKSHITTNENSENRLSEVWTITNSYTTDAKQSLPSNNVSSL